MKFEWRIALSDNASGKQSILSNEQRGLESKLMSRKAARYTQAELDRAVKAASKLDCACAVEARPDGTIRIVFGDAAVTASTNTIEKDWRL